MNSSIQDQSSRHLHYIGRFAPSPSGPLHFGSLIGALASFCDARAHGGTWLVRMEDLDPPREQAGAASAILKTLENHGLHWDGEVMFQSSRHAAYRKALDTLTNNKLTYPCYCTRKQLQQDGAVYPGYCLHQPPRHGAAAMRLKTPLSLSADADISNLITFEDIFFGLQHVLLSETVGDFIIKRKDGLFAYQLAVVVDDEFQHITHVIRGSDLLDSTAPQIYLQQMLNYSTPSYGHVPVATNSAGQKLSKQHHAAPLDENIPSLNVQRTLQFLHQSPPTDLHTWRIDDAVTWAVANWDRAKIPNTLGIAINDNNALPQNG